MSDDIEHLKVNKIVRREGDRVGLEVYGRLAPAPPVTEAVGGSGQEPAGPVDREALRERIVETLKSIFDPEIPVNIYDLGLIYAIEAETPTVTIDMTFTSDACPSAREIPHDIRTKLLTLDGVEAVDFHIVWDPAWHPRMIAESARRELGIDDDALGD